MYESRLLSDRIVFLGEEVSDTSASVVIAQMLFLEAQDPEKDIHLYINSPGGSVTAGFAIYDTMQYIKCDVSTICIGQVTDIRIMSDHLQKSKQRLNFILAENTGKSIEEITADTERDHYLSVAEALEYGLIDKIIDKRKNLP